MSPVVPQPMLDSLLAAEGQMQRAQLLSDVGALDTLIHAGLRFIGLDTKVYGKSDDLDAHRDQTVRFVSSEQLELDAQVFGSAAVTTALLALELEVSGDALAGTYRYIRGWVHEEGRWQIASGAVVVVPEQLDTPRRSSQ